MSKVTIGEISAQRVAAAVPYAVLRPDQEEKLPVCILLLGAGGSRDNLFNLRPLFDA